MRTVLLLLGSVYQKVYIVFPDDHVGELRFTKSQRVSTKNEIAILAYYLYSKNIVLLLS
jgi:hypothetical protein